MSTPQLSHDQVAFLTSKPGPKVPLGGRLPMRYRTHLWKTNKIDPQTSTILYNIPTEIRDLIFKFAFSNTALASDTAGDYDFGHNFHFRQDHDKLDDESEDIVDQVLSKAVDPFQGEEEPTTCPSPSPSPPPRAAVSMLVPPHRFLDSRTLPFGFDRLRPGDTGPRRPAMALLGTCRQIYLDYADRVVADDAETVSYCDQWAPWREQEGPHRLDRYFAFQTTPEAARAVRRLHLYAPPCFLEGGKGLRGLARPPADLTGAQLGRDFLARNAVTRGMYVWDAAMVMTTFTANGVRVRIPMLMDENILTRLLKEEEEEEEEKGKKGGEGSANTIHYELDLDHEDDRNDYHHLHPSLLYHYQQQQRFRCWRVSEHLTSLRITFRRSDWLGWRENLPLAITPFSPLMAIRSGCIDPPTLEGLMRADMKRTRDVYVNPEKKKTEEDDDDNKDEDDDEETTRLHRRRLLYENKSFHRSWGTSFLRYMDLRTLTIDFETTEDKRTEMEEIVDWAVECWRFPVLRRLSANDDSFIRKKYRTTTTQVPHGDGDGRGEEEEEDEEGDLNLNSRTENYDYFPWDTSLYTSPVSIMGGYPYDILVVANRDSKKVVERTSWRGDPQHWSDKCTGCQAKRRKHEEWENIEGEEAQQRRQQQQQQQQQQPVPSSTMPTQTGGGCQTCDKRKALLRLGKGPQILSWAVTWTREPGPSSTTHPVEELDYEKGNGNQPMCERTAEDLQREVEQLLDTPVVF